MNKGIKTVLRGLKKDYDKNTFEYFYYNKLLQYNVNDIIDILKYGLLTGVFKEYIYNYEIEKIFSKYYDNIFNICDEFNYKDNNSINFVIFASNVLNDYLISSLIENDIYI